MMSRLIYIFALLFLILGLGDSGPVFSANCSNLNTPTQECTCSSAGATISVWRWQGQVCVPATCTYGCSGVTTSCNSSVGTCSSRYSDPECSVSPLFHCCNCKAISACTSSGCSCTPTTPVGYTATNNGCSITTTASCSGKDNCDKSCTKTSTYWFVETNTAYTQPSQVNMVVDGQSYSLSTNPSTPTIVKYPSTLSNVKMSLPSQSVPSTAADLGYTFKVNNYGVNSEWIAWSECPNNRAEDICSESLANEQNFVPKSLPVLDVLKQTALGKLSGYYYTTNKCDSNKVYSAVREGYYKVDSLPTLNPTNPSCSMTPDAECTIKEIFPDVGTDESISSRGCKSEAYTGREVNNPLRIRLTGQDVEGSGDIKGAVVWFSKSGTTPSLPSITGDYTISSVNDIGIMILQQSNSWSNTPLVYATKQDNSWGLLANGVIKNISGEDIARLSDISVSENSGNVTFELKVEFIPTNAEKVQGLYQFKTTILDQYMVMGGGQIDMSRIQRMFNWGIDLENPFVDSVAQKLISPQEFYFNWNVSGTGSDITTAVVNAYRDNISASTDISLVSPVGYSDITLENLPDEAEIGQLGDTNSWRFENINQDPYVKNDSVRINVGETEGGVLSMYLTTFDRACNDNASSHNIDLRPWVATRGGAVYSSSSFSSGAKDVSQVASLDGAFENFNKSEIDITTEVVASKRGYIESLIHPSVGAVRALSSYDNNEKKGFWFSYLLRKLESQRDLLTDFVVKLTDTKVSDSCSGSTCIMYSAENIEIPRNYLCDKPTLIVSEKNIHINPNVTSNSTLNGCIFLARNNIEIGDGQYQSGGGIVGYDFVDAFLLAEAQIRILFADGAQTLRDGIEFEGGIISFGRGLVNTSAVSIERNLRLYNLSHPTLLVAWNPKYGRIAEKFFGTEAALYKQEVGFKPY